MTITSARERQFNRALGANIRRARRARGLTLADPAFGLHSGRLSLVERGRGGLRLTALLQIAEVLGVAPVSLFPRKRIRESGNPGIRENERRNAA